MTVPVPALVDTDGFGTMAVSLLVAVKMTD